MDERRTRELEGLKKNSPYVLPNNPSQSGWTTQQVKEKFYAGLFYLYNLFFDLREDLDEKHEGMVYKDFAGAIHVTKTPELDDELTNKAYVDSAIINAVLSVMRTRGSVMTYNDLPANPTIGDVYNVLDTGDNYAWTGTEWDKMAGEYYSKIEMNTLLAGKVDNFQIGNGLKKENNTLSSLVTAADWVINIEE